MRRAWAKLKSFITRLWSFLGDPKTKNALLVMLAIATAFGMIAPDAATSIRDSLIALAF